MADKHEEQDGGTFILDEEGWMTAPDDSQPMTDADGRELDIDAKAFMGISEDAPTAETPPASTEPEPKPGTVVLDAAEAETLRAHARAAMGWKEYADRQQAMRETIEADRQRLQREVEDAALPEDRREARVWLRNELASDPHMITEALRPFASPGPATQPATQTPEQASEVVTAGEWIRTTFPDPAKREQAIKMLPVLHAARQRSGFTKSYHDVFVELGERVKQDVDLFNYGPGTNARPAKPTTKPNTTTKDPLMMKLMGIV